MNAISIPAGVRGLLGAAIRRPRIVGLIGGGIVVSAVTGFLTFGPASAETVAAGGVCKPNAAYTAPATLDLSRVPTGMTVVDDGTATYGVGGSSVAMVRGALARCAPGFTGAERSGEYLAYTSYAVNWSYGVMQDGPDCRLSNVKVGLRLRQLLPRLLDSQSTDPSVTIKWSSFIAGLAEHEDGHKALDIAQARLLLDDLEKLRAPCQSISIKANNLTVTHLAAFVTANADHDHDTDFGRDQGAEW